MVVVVNNMGVIKMEVMTMKMRMKLIMAVVMMIYT